MIHDCLVLMLEKDIDEDALQHEWYLWYVKNIFSKTDNVRRSHQRFHPHLGSQSRHEFRYSMSTRPSF